METNATTAATTKTRERDLSCPSPRSHGQGCCTALRWTPGTAQKTCKITLKTRGYGQLVAGIARTIRSAREAVRRTGGSTEPLHEITHDRCIAPPETVATTALNAAPSAAVVATPRFSSRLGRRKRDGSMAIATLAVLLAMVLTLLVPIGCAPAAKTDAAGPAAEATHETRRELPGTTKTRRIVVRVQRGEHGSQSRGTGEHGSQSRGTGEHGSQSRGTGEHGSESRATTTIEDTDESDESDNGSRGRCGGSAMRSGAPAPLAVKVPAAQIMPLHTVLAAATIGQIQPETTTKTGDSALLDILEAATKAADEAGVEIEFVIDEYEHTTPTAETTASTFAETPSRLRTSSDEAAIGFNTTLRRFTLPWGGKATGGGLGIEAKVLGGDGVNVLHIIGAAVMVLAVIPLLRVPRRWGAAAVFGVTGLAIVMTGTLVDAYPWVTLLAGLIVLGLLGYGAIEAWRRGRAHAALDAITPVIEQSHNGDVIKNNIKQKAGRLLKAVKAETTASKARA